MLVCLASTLRTAASVLEKDIAKIDKGTKTVVFLGGLCEDDNEWRKEIKKEYGDKLFFLDPYDEHWEGEENIYDELAAMMKSDQVVFYKGGKGTEKEKKFLDRIQAEGGYEEFDDLDKLKEHLSRLSEPAREKTAKMGVSYDHASTQVDLPEDLAKEVLAWGKKNLKDADVYEKPDGSMGREDEIHVTVLYGIKGDSPKKIEKRLRGLKPFEVRLGLITAFRDGDDNDVVKIDAEAPELQKAHYLLDDKIENDNSYPTYQPHITVAYMKKGKADPYIGDDTFRGRTFKVDDITFSTKGNEKIAIPLK